jgi:hypothetical protein
MFIAKILAVSILTFAIATSSEGEAKDVAKLPAAEALDPLSDEDYSVLESGAACWLANSKSGQFLYDNMANAVVRLNKKAVKLNRKSGAWDAGFYECGQTYEYLSVDSKVTVTVVMDKGKTCSGKLIVKSSQKPIVVSNLKSNCGA